MQRIKKWSNNPLLGLRTQPSQRVGASIFQDTLCKAHQWQQLLHQTSLGCRTLVGETTFEIESMFQFRFEFLLCFMIISYDSQLNFIGSHDLAIWKVVPCFSRKASRCLFQVVFLHVSTGISGCTLYCTASVLNQIHVFRLGGDLFRRLRLKFTLF